LPIPKVSIVVPLCPWVLHVWIPLNLDLKYSERVCGESQVVEHLLSKCESLTSTLVLPKNPQIFQKRNCVWIEHIQIFGHCLINIA
jgi:hypothetical protein